MGSHDHLGYQHVFGGVGGPRSNLILHVHRMSDSVTYRFNYDSNAIVRGEEKFMFCRAYEKVRIQNYNDYHPQINRSINNNAIDALLYTFLCFKLFDLVCCKFLMLDR